MNDRRHRIDRQTRAERDILGLIAHIETLGADPRLTASQQALEVAFNCVADWVDFEISKAEAIDVVSRELVSMDPPSPVKVVPLQTVETANVIKTLNNFLKVAETEKLTGIAVVAVHLDGSTSSAYEQGHNIALLLGALLRIQQRLLDHGGR